MNSLKAKFQLINLLRYSLTYIFSIFVYLRFFSFCLPIKSLQWSSFLHSHSYRLAVSYDYNFCNFTWFQCAKWIFLQIFSCIMQLKQYSSELRANTKCIPRTFYFSNLKNRFGCTVVFQIITAKYNIFFDPGHIRENIKLWFCLTK